ncbi:DUF2069 domain-containing protein [Litorivicinus sp.]|nr:DUF2069 domain-containing protein [Litorivicinus sp.]
MTSLVRIFEKRKNRYFRCLLIALIGLITTRLIGIWILIPTPSMLGTGGLTLLLFAYIWPVIKQDIKSCLWLSFISCLFFTIGVLNAMTDGRQLFGLLESVIAATIFVSAMLFARNAYKLLEATAEASKQSPTSSTQ